MYENTLQCPDIGTILQHGPEVILADCYPIFNEKLSYSPIIKRKNPTERKGNGSSFGIR